MRAVSSLLFVLVFGACAQEAQTPREMTNADRGRIQAEVLTWANQWLDAATNLDVQGSVAFFDQADGHFYSGAGYQPTWQAFVTATEELYGGWDVWEADWESTRVDVLSPDAALFVGEAVGMIRYTDGDEFDNRATFSFVVRKAEEGWKGLFGHVTGSSTARQ